MRPAVLLLSVALLAAACADSGDDPSAGDPVDSTTTSTVTSAPSTTAVTTTTVEAAPETGCPAVAAVGRADVDGDGEHEDLLLAEREGGQALWICGNERARSLELEYAVWYVAVVDVEPDGVDDVFLGAAAHEDAPGIVSTQLYRIDTAGDGLTAETEGLSGVWLGPSTGVSCLDLDGDGARELVELISGVDDDAVPGTFSCGDAVVDVLRIRPPAAICETGSRFSSEALPIDLDRDGIDDLARQRDANGAEVLRGFEFGGPAVAVCLASGITDEVLVGGMGEVFGVGEGPADTPVVWTGGTSVGAAYSDPMVWQDDRLVFVHTADGGVLTLRDGYEGTGPLEGDWGASGCGDVDGDGTEEFVQAVVRLVDDELAWTRRTWHLDGATAIEAAGSGGAMPMPDGFDIAQAAAEAQSLVPDDC
ncbi:MAG: hypothetical protein R8F63_13255 [Acidimicrobiales bacterium]|nr:hypothetical protein [Acidimicrobiales bacterium]